MSIPQEHFFGINPSKALGIKGILGKRPKSEFIYKILLFVNPIVLRSLELSLQANLLDEQGPKLKIAYHFSF